MEEKIYRRQIVKLSTAHRVVDEHQIERHFKFDDVNELYKFEPENDEERPTPVVPKDKLLADLIISEKTWVDSYFEHDSLLQNQMDEQLTEEERQAAWQEYRTRSDERPAPNVLNNLQNLNNIPGNLTLHHNVLIDVNSKLKERFPNVSPTLFAQCFNICRQKMEILLNLTNFVQKYGVHMDPLRLTMLKSQETQLKESIITFLNGNSEPITALRNLVMSTSFSTTGAVVVNPGINQNTNNPILRNSLANISSAAPVRAQFNHLGQSVVRGQIPRPQVPSAASRSWANVVPYDDSSTMTTNQRDQTRTSTITSHNGMELEVTEID